MISWLRTKLQHHVVLPDVVLVKKIQRGDRDAFGMLYLKYLDKLYRYMYFRVNQNQVIAEDLVEAVFIKAWGSIDGFRPNGASIQSWLYTIAHNTLIDYYRTRRPTSQLDESLVDPGQSVEDHFDQRERQKTLKEAINKLTDEQKQIIILKFIEGFSNEEIAIILHKSQQALRALQYRALRQLKKYLQHI